MLIAILGDVHSNLTNLKKALEIIKEKKIGQILCVGDLQDPESLDIIGNTNIKFSFVFGNSDWDKDLFYKKAKEYKNIEILGDIGELEISDKDIALVHYVTKAKELAKSGRYDIVFSGHRHSPWEERIGNTTYLRAGEIAGQFYPPTFCIYDLSKMKAELILINN